MHNFGVPYFDPFRQHHHSLPQVVVLTPDENPTVPPSADVAAICESLGYEHRVARSDESTRGEAQGFQQP